MKPGHDIVAERALAKHAEELIKPRAAEPGLEETSRYFATALGRALRDKLAVLLGGAELNVESGAAEQSEAGKVFGQFKAPAAHFQIAGLPGLPSVLASLSRRDTLAMCDRAYGGIGAVPDADADDATQDLPGSADLLLVRLGEILADALGEVAGVSEGVHVARRGPNLERLAPFGSRADTLSFNIAISEEGRESWTLNLMALGKGFAAFLQAFDKPLDQSNSKPVPTGPDDEPFSEIPLPLRAVLAEMRLSASRVANLSPGDELALSIPREVPLLVRGTPLARGTVGTLDERIALKLTNIHSAKGSNS